jgi:drug/metabolite transporter (DMT)-like permease
MRLPTEQRGRAALFALAAILLATTQDAIVKSVSGSYPASETVVIRCLASLPVLAVWLMYTRGFAALRTSQLRLVVARSLILCSAYFAFILAISAMPLANAVSIYFTMPFFVAALAGPVLGERVPWYRLVAIAVGFCGVLIMERPGVQSFQPAALLALYSAAGYAFGQMLGRKLAAAETPPIVIANYQNFIYLLVAVAMALIVHALGLETEGDGALAFLTRAWAWPSTRDFLVLLLMGLFAALAMMCFISAYSLAASSFVAPFEYSAMVWAVVYGFTLFGDWPDGWHMAGMAVVVAAGLFMLALDTKRQRG